MGIHRCKPKNTAYPAGHPQSVQYSRTLEALVPTTVPLTMSSRFARLSNRPAIWWTAERMSLRKLCLYWYCSRISKPSMMVINALPASPAMQPLLPTAIVPSLSARLTASITRKPCYCSMNKTTYLPSNRYLLNSSALQSKRISKKSLPLYSTVTSRDNDTRHHSWGRSRSCNRDSFLWLVDRCSG